MAARYSRSPLAQAAIPGVAWLQWAQPSWRHRIDVWCPTAQRVIIAMLGGSTDYSTTANRTGAQTYADEVTIANALRALGSAGQVKVIGSTTHPSTGLGANTTVAAGSNGVNLSTFTGAATLNVASTTDAFAGTSTLKVQASGGMATVTYTGLTGTTFTGCTATAGSGTLATGNTVRQINYQNLYDGNALVLADASAGFDAIVDYAALMPDPHDLTYYQADGTHETAAAADRMLLLGLAPALEPLLL